MILTDDKQVQLIKKKFSDANLNVNSPIISIQQDHLNNNINNSNDNLDTLLTIQNNNNPNNNQSVNSQFYSSLSSDQQIRVREQAYKLNMENDEDEFSNLKLYKPRHLAQNKKYNYSKLNYYPRKPNSDNDDNDYDDDEDSNVDDEKYCCDCPCCKCPWPIPPGVWCVKDVCGLVCATITWCLVFYAEFVVMFVMIIPSPYTIGNFLNTIIFHVLGFLALSSHAAAMLTDPGSVPLGNATPENIEKIATHPGQIIYRCPRCLSIKPLRAHHCSVCKRCIKKMDHHCPWVNNCVGESNQKFFVLFTLYIFLISLHAIVLIIMHMIKCVDNDWLQCSSFSPAATLILVILLGFESLLFGIFTLVMFCTQISAILSDETQIETLKNEEPKWTRKNKWTSLKSVFGGEMSIFWLSPFTKPNKKYLQATLSKLLDV